ncbi:1-deoxy-D-xylulose-5-phosphate synthase [Leptospira biflexa]|uniref:1-deoxy-D-xylulose-5-phosphate synthase n=1 Tax=Leptospira biflexa TaxID=172 RepID=UPI0010828BD0|nr:1-deoxy-D-xylulose-5-phosphate synthase [Leptospira biflexa]TGM32240.1 1-deoxy-D-xylulose-5-phosphate synthase [Leptospira biflexa]TGM33806.1 1-deoxy-D-xylulose-5-phosphate synthase [Leptospira biflexa]TGM42542.1 1-deoxy-D-xylulose-5-phosphate synthase [Leptospira biflexa]TGM44428.1 1-deoxy-D-xylulose-5-phosphate synthase [Leptospira biflexa]TGM57398.1 1-deoxy-D-xylulose-5-phosphate synthase [Leptospira biflexa]
MPSYPYLDKINFPQDLRNLKEADLPAVCHDLREYIIDTLSDVGGHFASNLGVVELTVALHYVFQTPKDKIIWDVGHQTYPHKILTGRKKELPTVRKWLGLSGFPKREESEYDLYNTGHAGTSISQALGEACARDLMGESYKVAAVIGDASIATGMALEAMNHGGHIKPNMLVILNDNYMSISKNVGSISNYLNRIISSQVYNKGKTAIYSFLKWIPLIGPALQALAHNMETSFKHFMMRPGGLFEDLGFTYFGPIDGHDVNRVVQMLQNLSKIQGPILLHVLTQKGKGYKPAEADPIKYHGVTPFNKESGKMASADANKIGLSKIVGKTLMDLTNKDKRIAVITPAMIEGSGLRDFQEAYPNHTFDVGIAEQHSVAFAGAMTNGGAIPFMCIYSTFLTRAMDQLVEDVSLMNLPVRFVIDRAGIVGPDGETHQGLSDLGYLAGLPNMDIIVPSSAQDIIDSLHFMKDYSEHPIAIRFPKDNGDLRELKFEKPNQITKAKARVVTEGEDLLILSLGFMLPIAGQVAEILKTKGISVSVIDLFWLRPYDKDLVHTYIAKTKRFVILDESYLHAGASGYLLNEIPGSLIGKFLKTFALPLEPIHHGERNQILEHYRLTATQIAEDLLSVLQK